MITHFRVRNYKALRDVALDLTPIHVLIGPNDSGKTSILEAITALCRLVDQPFEQAFEGRWQGRDLVWRGAPEPQISFEVSLKEGDLCIEYEIACRFLERGRDVSRSAEQARTSGSEVRRAELKLGSRSASSVAHSWHTENLPDHWIAKLIHDVLFGAQSYRWLPSHLARPVAFGFPLRFAMLPSGFGLATFLDDILAYDHRRYGQLEEHFHEFFPYVKRIRLRREEGCSSVHSPNPDSPGYGIYFELTDQGQLLPAAQASDGLLLVLAYLTILYSPQPPRLWLIEEPENGIHPRRLADVLKVLKELVQNQNRTQVLLTTHSPYVVDLFQPQEVTLCLRESDGAVTTHRLSESKAVREQLDIFQLGEIWTAEGDEALAAPAGRP